MKILKKWKDHPDRLKKHNLPVDWHGVSLQEFLQYGLDLSKDDAERIASALEYLEEGGTYNCKFSMFKKGTEFIKDAPNKCPYCESDNISYIDGFGEDNSISVRCQDCGKTWAEIYSFDSIIELD